MKVLLKRPWFCDGYRWTRPGEHDDVPDRFKDQLPSDAEIIGSAASGEEPEAKPKGDVKLKGYRLMPKDIPVDGHDPVETQGAIRAALKASGKSPADWNSMKEDERKPLILQAAQDIAAAV